MSLGIADGLEFLPAPVPDVECLKSVLRRVRPDRVPLVELAIADEVLAALNGQPLVPIPSGADDKQWRAWANDRVRLWHRLGYDYYRVRVELPFILKGLRTGDTAHLAQSDRVWANEHAGPIRLPEDLERYPWPSVANVSFAAAEAVVRCLPEGMGMIGFCGGVLEWASTLMGLESFMLALHEDPPFVRALVDRVGQIIHDTLAVFCQMDRVFAIWLGDDLGYKTATLIAPEHLREYILPWHRKMAELAHRTGRFFILHSCGNVAAIMPDLIHHVGIDAKHSFEDVIVPVEQFQQRWGREVAVLGGVDVDLLSRGSIAQVRQRTAEILERCAPAGGYACGSGNSVTNYVPPANFLAMVETVHRFNGRM